MPKLVSFTPFEETAPDIPGLIDAAADRYGVSRDLAHTVARMESNYDPRAQSKAGAQGVMQLMPATARSLGVTDRLDPAQNVDAGVRLLSQLSDKYSGDTSRILAAYNAGEGAVDKAGGVPPYRETQNYVAKGLQNLPANVAKDPLSRLMAGEDVELTPEVIQQITIGKLPGSEPPPAPAAAAPAPQPAKLLKFEPYQAPPEPPKPSAGDELRRLGGIAAESSGLSLLNELSYAPRALMDRLTGNPPGEAEQRAVGAIKGFAQGIANEPMRMREQLVQARDALINGDVNAAADHLWFAVPIAGPMGQVMKEYLDRGDVSGAFAHALGALAPVAGHPAVEAVKAAPEAIGTAADVTKGAIAGAKAEAMAPTTIQTPLGEATVPQFVASGIKGKTFGVPGAVVGALRPVVKGAIKGGREAIAATEAAAAPAAEIPVTPVTGMTDDAIQQLYGVETNPAKRAAIETEMRSRGLLAEPPAAPNPYSDYTQPALQRAYQVEQDPAKRSLIEQSAQDRGLTLYNREGRRATVTPPETGAPEERGPSITQTEAAVLEQLGIDPNLADAGTIAAARQIAAEQAQLPQRPQLPQQAPANVLEDPRNAYQYTTPEQVPVYKAPEPPEPPQQAPPSAVAPPPPEPATVPVDRKAAALKAAQDLEESMRVETLTDYAVRKQIPAAMMGELGPEEWRMIAEDARTQPPTEEQIAQIRRNVAAQETPATATQAADAFQQAQQAGEPAVAVPKRTRRAKAQPAPAPAEPLPPATPEQGQAAAEGLAQAMPEHAGPPPAPGEPAPTASELRVEGLAQALHGNADLTPELVAGLAESPEARAHLETLSNALDLGGRPTPDEIPAVIKRFRELRAAGEEPPARPPAGEMGDLSMKSPDEVNAAFERAKAEQEGIANDPFMQRIIDKGEEAKQRLRDRGIFDGGQASANAFFDPEVIRDFSLSIAGDIARGALTFKQFSTRMVKQYGPEIKQHLPEIWHRAVDVENLIGKPVEVASKAEQPLTSDVGKALEAEVGRKLGTLAKDSPADLRRQRAIEQASADLRYAVTQENSGQDWYTGAVERAENRLRAEVPELNDPTKMKLFKYLLAVTSNGVNPAVNLGGAMKAFDLYLKTGKLHAYDPVTGVGMTFRANSYQRAMNTLSKLLEEKGEQGTVDWLMTEHPVSELNSYAGKGKVPGKASDMRLGAYILGEKVGAFGSNLNGIHTELTADKWWSRTWNRWMGTIMATDAEGKPILDEETGEPMLQDTPRTQSERALMRDVAAHVADKLGLKVDELQAVLWYVEQRLYRAHGLDAGSISYEDAVNNFFDRRAVQSSENAVDRGPTQGRRKVSNR